MAKTIRCIVCRELFSEKELKDNEGCPTCGYSGYTMMVKGDERININWLELRVLCTWAEQFAIQGADQDSINAFYSTVKEIEKQIPDCVPLTMYKTLKVQNEEDSDILTNELPPEGTTFN